MDMVVIADLTEGMTTTTLEGLAMSGAAIGGREDTGV